MLLRKSVSVETYDLYELEIFSRVLLRQGWISGASKAGLVSVQSSSVKAAISAASMVLE